MKTTYEIDGWNKNISRWAIFTKDDYKTYGGALRAYEHYKTTGKYTMLVIRENIEYSEHSATSRPIHKWKSCYI